MARKKTETEQANEKINDVFYGKDAKNEEAFAVYPLTSNNIPATIHNVTEKDE